MIMMTMTIIMYCAVPYRPRAKFRDMSSHDKWVIVDVTSPHCQRQGRFQAPEGWKVILAREATHSNNDNLSLLYTLFSDPSASQGVGEGGEGPMLKNAAYLTAILRGVRHLLDTDCSLSAVHVLHVTRPSRHGLLYNDTRLFNPYAHFGAWASVPRAVSAGGHPNNSKTYYIRDFHSVAVKHALSDTSRDAVSVLSNNGASKHGVGVTFDPSTPPVFLGRRSFAPAVAASSLYQQQALWGLLLPCVSPTPACHVLRQLVLQRLLWELDAFSAYYQLPASVVRSNLSADGPASQSPPYLPGPVLNVAALSSLLDAWTCDTNLTFYGCFRSLADLLYKEGYLQQQDHQLVLVWIKALHSPGLTEPARVAHPWSGRRRVGEVKVRLGSLQHRVQSRGEDGLQQLWQQSVQPVIERCSISDAGWLPSPALWTSPIIDDIVLIIVFNVNNYFWPNLAFLETVHRPFFKHIVYCVSDSDQLSSAREYEAWHHVILVEGLSDGWYLMYGCVTSVIQMNLAGVKGYLMIGDDTLLNTWNLFNMSRDVITQHKKSHPRHADNPKSPGWMWWPMEIGRCAIVRGLAGLEKISGLSSQQLLALIPGWNHSHTTLTFTHILEKQWMDLTCGQLQGSEVRRQFTSGKRITGVKGWGERGEEGGVRGVVSYQKTSTTKMFCCILKEYMLVPYGQGSQLDQLENATSVF